MKVVMTGHQETLWGILKGKENPRRKITLIYNKELAFLIGKELI